MVNGAVFEENNLDICPNSFCISDFYTPRFSLFQDAVDLNVELFVAAFTQSHMFKSFLNPRLVGGSAFARVF